MTDIVIAGAARTPVGAFNGGLASLPAHKLGEVAIAEALRRAQVDPKEVSEVIMGQILAAVFPGTSRSGATTYTSPSSASAFSSAARPGA